MMWTRMMKEKLMFGLLMAWAATPVWAQGPGGGGGGGDLPWVKPLCMIATSLHGPVASAVAIIVLVVTGLMFAFGEASGTFKTGLGVLGGLSLAFLAIRTLTSVFGGDGFQTCSA